MRVRPQCQSLPAMLMLLLSRELPPVKIPGEAMWTLWWPLARTLGKTFSSHNQACSSCCASQICFDGPGALQQGKRLVGRRVAWSVWEEGNTGGGSQ